MVILQSFSIKYLQFETYLEYKEAHIPISLLIVSKRELIRRQID